MRKFACLSAICVATLNSQSCKTSQSDDPGSETLAAGDGRPDIIQLDDFRYDLPDRLLKEAGARLGCEEAGKWVGLPRQGNLRQFIAELKTSPDPYRLMTEELFNPQRNAAACRRLAGGGRRSDVDGIKGMISALRQRGFGLTVLFVGGFGNHLAPRGAFHDAKQKWEQEIDEGASFRALRYECMPNSFDSDDACSPHLIQFFQEADGSVENHRYLLMGYSKGGTTALRALSESQPLRDKTLAVMTFGSPIGGGLAADMILPLLSPITERGDQLGPRARALVDLIKAFALRYASRDGRQNRLTAALQPQGIATVQRGATEMATPNKKRYLRDTVTSWSLAKSSVDPATGTSDTLVYHFAAATDLGSFSTLPYWTLDDGGKLKIKAGSLQTSQLDSIPTLGMFLNHPLGDTCVALEHAVLDQRYLPQNTKTELTGLYLMDHSQLGMERVAPIDPPTVALTDAAIAAVSTSIFAAGGR